MRADVFATELSQEYALINGMAPDTEFFENLIAIRRRRRDELRAITGAGQCAGQLTVAKAVASSSNEQLLQAKLARTELFGLFDPHIYSADRVNHGKPAPDIFLYAAERLSVDPHDCLVIEDSTNGVIAARAAGMAVWGFLGGGHVFDGHGDGLLAAGAARCVDDFSDLVRALDEIDLVAADSLL